MSDKLDATISITADTTGVEAGIDKTKKSLRTLGGAAQQVAGQISESGKSAGAGFEGVAGKAQKSLASIIQVARQMAMQVNGSGKTASEGLELIGPSATRSAKDVERATRSMQQQLQRQIAELNAGGKATREYTEALARMRGVDANALRPLLDHLDSARKKTDDANKSTDSLISRLGGLKTAAAGALAGLSVGALVSEISSITRETAKAAEEYERFSALSNTSVKEFQRLAAGANTVGISAEKMADIFKDTQDKVGDFVQTGGGGMADFFERVAPKVGVTAENFRKLSGKDALQLYVSSLEKANLSQSDMIFFMEAIASDSSLLLPLLKDQGRAWDELGDKAEAYGAILDGEALAAAKAFKAESDSLELAMKGLRIELAEGLLPSMTQFTAALSSPETRSALSDLAGWIGDISVAAVNLSTVIGKTSVWSWLQTGDVKPEDAAAEITNVEAKMQKVREIRDALERQGGKWAAADDIAIANGQLATMEAKLRGLQVMAQQYQAQQAAALKSMARSLGADALDSYVPEANRPKPLSAAYSKPSAKSGSLSEEESAYKSLAKSIAEMLEQQQLEIATGEKLTASQKLRLKVEQEVAKSKRAGLLADLDLVEANEAWLQNQSEVNKALADMQKAREQSLRSVQDSVRKLVEEAEAAAYAEVNNVSLSEALERLALARAENAYQLAVERQESQQTLEHLRQEIAVRKQLVAATAQKEAKEANKRAAEQAAKDWERTADTISRTLADYIMGGGKDAAQYLKRLFETLVLEPVVQTAVSSVMGGKTGGGLAGAGGLGSLGGGLTNWSNWGGTASDWLFDQGVGASMKGFESLGSSMQGLGVTVGRVDAYLKDIPGMSGGIGSAAGYLGSIYSLTQGQYGSALGSAIGTYIMPGIGTMIGGALGGLLDGLLGDEDAPYYGGVSSWSASTGTQTAAEATYGTGMWLQEDSPAMRQTLGTFAQTLGTSLDAFAKAFGSKAGYEVALGYADDSTSDNAWGALRIALGGQDVVNWDANRQTKWAPREFADGEEGYKQYLSAVAADVKTALLGMDLPGWAGQILASAKDLETLNAALQQIGAVKAVFDSLGHSMTMFADLGGSVQTTLLNVSGGIDALANNAQSFYANYFSEQERLDATVDSLTATFAKYGAALPATAEQYRALVEQQLAAGDAGAEFAAVLLGLNGTFKGVADAWKAELDGMSQTVVDFFAGIKDDIAAVMADVAGSRKDILRGTGVMTAAEIEAAIGAAMIYSPSMANVASAQGSMATASSEVAAAKAKADASAAQLAVRQGAVSAVQSAIDQMQRRRDATSADAERLTREIASYWDGGSNSGWSYGKRKEWSNEAEANRSKDYQIIAQIDAELAPKLRELELLKVAASAAVDASASDAQRLAAAQAALAAAQKAEVQAKADYAAQMQKFVTDAGQSVGKLSDLRGEVVDFYEAQAQAVQGMLQSAGNLRSLVDQVRLGQLTTAQTAAELGNRYALDYSMALATTGSTRAGYVDAMAGNLQSLSEAMKAEAVTGADWRVQTAKLLAQASNAAGLLEGDANADNYQDVSLGLLDSIDKALESLSGTTKSAEQVIADAVNNGTASNLAGLRAIVAALQGQSVPAFAAGGLHLGGLRIVGENGPELEATGPSRIWNQRQLAGALGGGGGSARTEQLLLQLIEEQRVQASRQVDLQLQLNKQMQRWDALGMPETREVSA